MFTNCLACNDILIDKICFECNITHATTTRPHGKLTHHIIWKRRDNDRFNIRWYLDVNLKVIVCRLTIVDMDGNAHSEVLPSSIPFNITEERMRLLLTYL